MGERLTEQASWIETNDADIEVMAQLIQGRLISPGDRGIITAREEGGGKAVIGPVDTFGFVRRTIRSHAVCSLYVNS